jgi:DNA invertase Pin-like site-specific DNA recombinase
MTVAAYIRVSSRGQDHAMQRAAVEKAAAARGDAIGTWFAEKRTATTLDRPELERLRAAVRAGSVRKVYVFKLDRLARTGIRDTLAIVDEFRAAGCALVTVADGFDLNTKAADLILAVMAWAAEMELHTRRERIAARRELADERGEPWGRPSRLTPATRARIVELRAAGLTVREVAARVKVPRATVGRVSKTSPSATAPDGPEPSGERGASR